MMMDIFGGVISGAGYAGSVGDQYKVFDRPQDVGHFFLAMRSDLFVPEADYHDRMDTLMQRVHDCPKAEGFSEILIPGEPETRHEALRRRQGIPYSAGEVAALQAEAERAGVAPLIVSDRPIAA
jgi:LDH2 family malate/lactate/ureidoglycolate dehydrogenase